MIKLQFEKRPLKEREIALLLRELHDYAHIGWLSASGWKHFDDLYIMSVKKEFVGVCATTQIAHWVKLGPVVISKHYQGKGFGKLLLTYVVNHLPGVNLYIGSSNLIIGHLVKNLGFSTKKSFFNLPREIQYLLFSYFLHRLNPIFVIDDIKKKQTGEQGEYRYYLKKCT